MIFLLLLLVMLLLAAGVSVAVTTALLRGRDGTEVFPGTGASPSDQRLRRLEATVEALTAEMERMREGQLFLTEVLSQRREGEQRLPPPPPPREG